MDVASGTNPKWKPYPKYKDSGVELLGDVPEHWDTSQIKWVSTKIGSGKTPKGGAESYASSGILFIRSQNIRFEGLYLNDAAFIDGNTDSEMASTRVMPGDVLLNITGASLGRCSLVPINLGPANVNQHVCIIRPRRETIQSSFLNRYLSSIPAQAQIFLSEDGVSREGLTFNQVGCIVIPLIPAYEQYAIAAFLDRETAKIDALIAKNERLIELLQEKRTALISHAVTKGLDPSAPMKDSGVEWLGEIPEHWDSIRLKYVCSLIKDGTHQPPSRTTTGVPLLSVRNIVNGKFINLPDDSLISEQDFQQLAKYFTVKQDDVLLAIVGATLGKVAIVEKMPPFYIQRSLAVFRPRSIILNFRFLSYFLRGNAFQQLIWKNVNFSAQPGIYLGMLSMTHIVLPSISEQKEIINFLDDKTYKLDEITLKIQMSIEKLKEYSTALISAAVTGKIDVRDEAGVVA